MSRRRPRGFSLLEVILALGILAGALVVLGELARQGLRYAERARDLTQAQLLCESKLAEICSSSSTPTAGGASPLENDTAGAQNWQCAVEVKSLSQTGLLSVRVTVAKITSDQARPVEVSLTRWMVDPEATFSQETEDEYSNMSGTP